MSNDHIYLSKKAQKFADTLPTLDIRDLRALATACQKAIDAAIAEVGEAKKPSHELIRSATNGSTQNVSGDATAD